MSTCGRGDSGTWRAAGGTVGLIPRIPWYVSRYYCMLQPTCQPDTRALDPKVGDMAHHCDQNVTVMQLRPQPHVPIDESGVTKTSQLRPKCHAGESPQAGVVGAPLHTCPCNSCANLPDRLPRLGVWGKPHLRGRGECGGKTPPKRKDALAGPAPRTLISVTL